ncbi:hypothetical protein AKJ16_DCAP24257 [Drosera capensis]
MIVMQHIPCTYGMGLMREALVASAPCSPPWPLCVDETDPDNVKIINKGVADWKIECKGQEVWRNWYEKNVREHGQEMNREPSWYDCVAKYDGRICGRLPQECSRHHVLCAWTLLSSGVEVSCSVDRFLALLMNWSTLKYG